MEMARLAAAESNEHADAFFIGLYQDLRRKAQQHLAGQAPDHTLQPTALVHEVYLRIADYKYEDREHFLAMAATAMRHVLVDHARKQRTAKRDAPGIRLALDTWIEHFQGGDRPVDLLVFEEVLERLAERSPEAARLVELRFYGGLTNPECARVLQVPLRTLEARWHATRAWLEAQFRP